VLFILAFQSTLPRRKWLRRHTWLFDDRKNFNPHFREGSDILVPHLFPLQKISIHTSAKEVTKLYELLRRAEKISIHTSAKEVTCIGTQAGQHVFISIHTSAKEVTGNNPPSFDELLFQSTLPRRKWLNEAKSATKEATISIHTSAKEVTFLIHQSSCTSYDFNPHFREGSDTRQR